MKSKKIPMSELPYGHLGMVTDHATRNGEYVIKTKCWGCKTWHIQLLGSETGNGWSESSGISVELFCVDLGPIPERYVE